MFIFTFLFCVKQSVILHVVRVRVHTRMPRHARTHTHAHTRHARAHTRMPPVTRSAHTHAHTPATPRAHTHTHTPPSRQDTHAHPHHTHTCTTPSSTPRAHTHAHTPARHAHLAHPLCFLATPAPPPSLGLLPLPLVPAPESSSQAFRSKMPSPGGAPNGSRPAPPTFR